MSPRTLRRACVVSAATGLAAGLLMTPAGAAGRTADPSGPERVVSCTSEELPGTSSAALYSPLATCEHGRKMR
jgi:hypothetical protein